jgi:hypothetical protein
MNKRNAALVAAGVGVGGLILYALARKASAATRAAPPAFAPAVYDYPPATPPAPPPKTLPEAVSQLTLAKQTIVECQNKLAEVQQLFLTTQRDLEWYKTRNYTAPGPLDPVRVPLDKQKEEKSSPSWWPW